MALHHRPVFADKKVIICALCFIQFVVYSMRNPVNNNNTKLRQLMHQSIPAAPSIPTPPGYCGAIARLVSPGGPELANFTLPGDRAFANPGAKPELLKRTRFPIST